MVVILGVAFTRHCPAGTAEESRSQGCPNSGSGLEVWGELKPRIGRLVVTKAQAVTLPPKRVVEAPVAG